MNSEKLIAVPEKFRFDVLPMSVPRHSMGMKDAVQDLGSDAFGRETELEIYIQPANGDEKVPFQKYLFHSGDTSQVFVKDVEINRFSTDHKRDIILREIKKGSKVKKTIEYSEPDVSFEKKEIIFNF